MGKANPFGSHSTADKVLAGIDLSGKSVVVTGCTSGLGFETMNALTSNGAHVFGLARSLEDAAAACRRAGPFTTPIACDLADLESVAAAADAIGRQTLLDAIVANAGIAHLPTPQVRYGVERQFLVNHLGHFALIRALEQQLRPGAGRVVIVSASAGVSHAPPEGIMFDNLDGRRSYDPMTFYSQSKFANALHAKELSRRLAPRGIMVNSLHPGAARGTRLHKNTRLAFRIALSAAQPFMRSPAQGAATQALLAASPLVEGITGEYWFNCDIARAHPLVDDVQLAQRLWAFSEDLIERHSRRAADKVLSEAA
ncbi:MAG TPA: SDR family NAD(P)-dependent oxidoreductase [Steroidobacteraceae bacterium]|jgi:WW domain-containing oxidoreductase|nr:SDR family NAD(P)-dependent oxidoreductase [Steroidobacteraceae bacterium]